DEERSNGRSEPIDSRGSLAVATAPPKVRLTAQLELESYRKRQKSLVIRHRSGDDVVALLEIVSPGNKRSINSVRTMIDKFLAALTQGIHLLVVDLQPPTKRDPEGLHGLIVSELEEGEYVAPPNKPLTAASYSAGEVCEAFWEPLAVGDSLPAMPLFL